METIKGMYGRNFDVGVSEEKAFREFLLHITNEDLSIICNATDEIEKEYTDKGNWVTGRFLVTFSTLSDGVALKTIVYTLYDSTRYAFSMPADSDWWNQISDMRKRCRR